MNKIDPKILETARQWTMPPYDEQTRRQVQYLMDNDAAELIESFYTDLEFGTGGLRGIMGPGTNRMNIYTVGMATQGLANYLKMNFPDKNPIQVVIAHDCRNNGRLFAQTTANVLSANGIKVFLFDDLRPTPELSFAVRFLGCQSGIVITASHNPKEYNGYKAYWEDGGQLVSPHDKNVIAEVNKIKSIQEVNFTGNPELIETIGESVDKAYIAAIKNLSLYPEIIAQHKNLKIVYTPIHGTGVKLAPWALREFGFEQIITVDEQMVVSGDFPTVHSPNPEEPAALDLAIKKARETGADLVMGTDPDGDRVGIAVKDEKGEFVLLNGNQTASLLIYYILKAWKAKGLFKGNEFIVKTIVTSELIKVIAQKEGVKCFDVLTGFKYIADLIRRLEGSMQFIAGGEESYGFLTGDFVRDKDAISACCMIAETAAWAANQNKSLYRLLKEIYLEYGFYKETLLSITKKGIAGAEEIRQMMENYRKNPPQQLAGIKVTVIKDYLSQTENNLLTHEKSTIDLPKSDVLQFFLEDGSKITVRPSGTEPKIKFYFGAKTTLHQIEDYEKVNLFLSEKIEAIKHDMGLA
ncbi:MAG TPA: phospho-sugar mutase [Bacteroidales bacterium]|nr:phospho-sugar mutase [Bacteroidales bacterium]